MSPTVQGDGRRKRWLAVVLSILVHSAIVAAVGWSWWQLREPARPPQQLAIEATVVMEKTAHSAPAAAPPAPVEQPPEPAPKPEDTKAAKEQAEREQEKEAAAAAAKLKEQQTAEREAKEAQATKEAEERAAQEQQRVAHEKSKRESELRAQLAVEERINAERGSADEVAWLALIRDRVTRAWIRPPSARAGVNCEVLVTQVPGGVVTAVRIGSCNGDSAVRESIEAAVYRA